MAKKKAEADEKGHHYNASNIKVLGGIEAVRKRPAMYIGSTGKSGLHHLVYEVVDNSIDEALAGHCDTINVTIHKDNTVTVTDNGRGIPIDTHKETKKPAAEVVLTTLHAGGKFGDSAYKVSGGLHGVGVSCVNALSDWMDVTIRRDGKVYEQHFDRGKPKKAVIKTVKAATKDTGTEICFKPDKEIFTELIFERRTIEHRLRELAFLNKGVTIVFTDQRETEKEKQIQTFKFDGGVVSYVEHLNSDKQALYKPPVYISTERDNVFVEVAFQHVKDYYDENLYTFVNCIKTKEGGTHLSGFKSAFTKAINTYARKNNFLKENESLDGNDVREGLTAVINTRVPDPQFEGQTKMKLGNSEVKGIVDSIVVDGLGAFMDKNPAAAKAMVERALMAYRVRMAARKAQELERKKSALDTATLPGKLADCSESNPEKCELFIVEGDSAGGCFLGNTKIALADGRALSFVELAKEWQNGKTNYCYTIKDDKSIGVEKILHPRITKKNAEVIKIVLDNDEEIICTPDHKFMLRGGSYTEAKDLSPKMSLMPLRRKLSERKGLITIKGYEMVLNPKTHRWVFTHILSDQYNLAVGKYGGGERAHRHRVDFNKLNNNPENIIRMDAKEHVAYHHEHLSKTLHSKEAVEKCNNIKRSPEYREAARKKSLEKRELFSRNAKQQWKNEEYKLYMIDKFKDFYNSNEAYRKESLEILKKEQKKYWGQEENRKKQSKRVSEFFKKHPELKEWLSDQAKQQWDNEELLAWRSGKTKEQWTDEFRAKRSKAYGQTYLDHSLHFLKQILEQRGEAFFYDHDRRALKPRNNNLLSMRALAERFFDGDEEKVLEAAQNYNHKIKRIEKVEERYDVYDIEVPNTHNFALASGIFVHNSAKQGRDRRFQAILPLRGKILNVEKARLDKILASNEIRILITAIGPGVISGMRGDGRNKGEKGEEEETTYEDIAKELRYYKTILLADADVDGAHIRTLLLTFFYRYARELIENGHLYIAQPPLYLVKKGKTQQYCYSEAEMEKVRKKMGREGVHIQRYKGLGEMNPEQLWETTLNPETRTLLQVTLDDAEEADEIFKILMGSEVEPRRKFIQENAKFVRNLDV
ncbi:MAG: DNA topoisomerase (ATP-hydrolyzing) subunit B [Candidatus Margulisbacteria bacterium]|nr:DNA topoisomerase (ATP-hydrolyzing) subunit B [Candidatus Margulisiibacteriota bacterium]MBU1021977.1 DNA topoisomerase (ATP-hydrolyzing) subunit B [Candidatus Margulisiibacteriota bacterium]MBU1728955.1 DNA topoisomerase (ATP-hydrolyzing) subunit B [Candidatus Margulisiibacteriota bacterium]MBU1954761.1 DNA topoisomerase (ATP-hydrolyzing) subunit B [Candidatus Margulisiibacteriota bacterium]